MKLILLDKFKRNPLDELSAASSAAFAELFSQTMAEISAESLERFWSIDSVYAVSGKLTENNRGSRRLPCFENIPSVFRSFGKSQLESTFIVAESDRMMLPKGLPVFEKVRLLQPCFLCDGKRTKVLCIIKGSLLYDICSRKNPFSVSDIYALLKNEKIKCSLFPVSGEFGLLYSVRAFRDYAFKLLENEIFDNIREVKNGIFCIDRMPTGNFVAVPPVYFGKNVQIETGAVIGPSVIVGDSCLISESARIENSVLCPDVYVSKDCYVNGAIIGESASLRRNCAVLPDSVVGALSLIGEGAVAEKGCRILHSSVICNDYDCFNGKSDGLSDKLLIDENNPLPHDAASLGKMFAVFTDCAETAVINDGSVSSYLLKNAFIAGAAFAGARIIDCGEGDVCQCVAVGGILNVDYTVFISSSQSRKFSFSDRFGRPFTRREVCEMCCRSSAGNNDFKRAEYPLYNSSWRDAYTDGIFERLTKITNMPRFNIECQNNVISFVIKTFRLFTAGENDVIMFTVSKSGERLTAEFEATAFSHEKLLSIASLYELRSGSVIKLPWNAPSFLAEINEYNGKISFGESAGAFDGAWAFDAFFLAVKVLEAVSVTGRNLTELSADIPEFFIAERSLDIDVQPCRLQETADSDMLYGDGMAQIKTDHGSAKIMRDMYRNKLHIITEAANAEYSRELTGEVMKIINAALDNNCK